MRKLYLQIIVLLALFGGVFALVQPAHPVQAFQDPFTTTPEGGGGGGSCKAGGTFLGFKPWYAYLKGKSSTDSSGKVACRPYIAKPAEVWLIVAALFEDLLYIAGVAAVGFIIWGAFQYMMSQGDAGRISNAKSTITNAVVGLVTTVVAGRLVGFIAGKFNGGGNTLGLPTVAANSGTLHTVPNTVFELAGAVAVIFVIWGGITYARSDGDPSTIKQAKETILYALVGLVLAIFAQALVSFVLSKA